MSNAGTAQRREKFLACFPTIDALRDQARKRGPHFAFEYVDGGAGADGAIVRNRAAFDAIKLMPRAGMLRATPSTEVEIFGRRYSAPIGIAPMGTPGIAMPGADLLLAKAAQEARIPYTLGLIGGAAIEEIAAVAPDVFWFQMMRCAQNDHKMAFDLMRRAEVAGAHVLVLTMDVPVYTTRPRASKAGLGSTRFRPTPRMILDMVMSPTWTKALLENGIPRFASLKPYAGGENASLNDVIAFTQREVGGPFSWEEVKRYRDYWKRPLVIKGILHPDDAEKAIGLGADGIIVSNHGGRQIDALPASIDCLADVVKMGAGRATIFLDSGVRSGSDIVRAMALGAAAAFAGKGFLWSLLALGAEGPSHAIRLLQAETQAVLAQLGAASAAEAVSIGVLQPPHSCVTLR